MAFVIRFGFGVNYAQIWDTYGPYSNGEGERMQKRIKKILDNPKKYNPIPESPNRLLVIKIVDGNDTLFSCSDIFEELIEKVKSL